MVDERGPGECWTWTGSIAPDGYGRFRSAHRGPMVGAHRAAWEFASGPIPEGAWVLHRCDNPPCCNPAHLFLGDVQANHDDMHAKGRWSPHRREAHPMAKLTEPQVAAIRDRLARGEYQRTIAADFGVVPGTIGKIARGERWGGE